MRRVVAAVLVAATASMVQAAMPLAQAIREELKIQQKLLELHLAELKQEEELVQDAGVRVDRQATDLLRSQEQGESLDSLRLREADLRQAESELMMHIRQAQQLRREVIASRMQIDETLAEAKRLEEKVGKSDDPLSGPWHIVVEPGAQDGYMSLRLDGTLVDGTYQLSGGWSGSLRGTWVAGKVRLERIDSQIGFASVFYARLTGEGDSARLEGTWEATQLATGMPSMGTWVADRVAELPQE
jgi:hypothetical protein